MAISESMWRKIALDFMDERKTITFISKKYAVSRAAITKHFKALGVQRSGSQNVRAKAEKLIAKDNLSQKDKKKRGSALAAEMINTQAAMLVEVIKGHRSDASRLRKISCIIMDRLEELMEGENIFAELGKMLRQKDNHGADKLNDIYNQVIELPEQVEMVRKLALTLKTLIELERKIFKIESAEDPADAAARGAAEGVVTGLGEFAKSSLADLIVELKGKS